MHRWCHSVGCASKFPRLWNIRLHQPKNVQTFKFTLLRGHYCRSYASENTRGGKQTNSIYLFSWVFSPRDVWKQHKSFENNIDKLNCSKWSIVCNAVAKCFALVKRSFESNASILKKYVLSDMEYVNYVSYINRNI